MRHSEMTLRNKIILHGLSALLPMLVLGIAFIRYGIYPFGNRQILVFDAWHQYHPFLSVFWHNVRGGNSWLWSWVVGGGHDYIAHMAYYLASPLNLLAALFPHSILREVMTAFVLVRLGLAGLFMSLCMRLSKNSDKNECNILLPVFSCMYALCAFALGYYWNVMWFDTFALLPLVMLGVHSLVREGKYKLYILSLAMAVLFNFYIGFFVCIFVFIMFFVHCFAAKLRGKEMLHRLAVIAAASVIALGMTAILTIPVYFGLQNAYSSTGSLPDFALYRSFADVLGNFIAFTPPTELDGLPNLYSGMMSVMLVPVFLMSKKISVREKIAYMAAVIFLVLSVNVNVLDFIWNGFRVTNMLPFRFSFLISFVLVFMAYRAYSQMDEIKIPDIIAMGLSAAFFIAMAVIGPQETSYILQSAVLAVVYVILFAAGAYFWGKKAASPLPEGSGSGIHSRCSGGVWGGAPFSDGNCSRNFLANKKYVFKLVLCAVILAELSITAYTGVQTVGNTDRPSHPAHYEQIQQLLGYQQPADVDFFRTELHLRWSFNASSLYGFNGISVFSSLANVNTNHFLQGLGLSSWDRGNRFYYAETSPLTNAFLNMRYLIVRYGTPADDGIFWDRVAEVGNSVLLRNNRYLPFGFMVNEDVAGYVGDRANPMNSQNDLFRRATGLTGNLFTAIDRHSIGYENYNVSRLRIGEFRFDRIDHSSPDGIVRFYHVMPEDGLLYVYARVTGANYARVVLDGDVLQTNSIRRPYIFFAGSFSQGDVVAIEADTNVAHGTASIHVGLLNQELFDEGFDLLSAETLVLTEFTDTRITGTVTASEPGLLYTSLPHANNWRVFVNGTRQEIVTIDGAMAAVRLGTGTHVVEFRHHNNSFFIGAGISVLSLLVFLVLVAFEWRKPKEDLCEHG